MDVEGTVSTSLSASISPLNSASKSSSHGALPLLLRLAAAGAVTEGDGRDEDARDRPLLPPLVVLMIPALVRGRLGEADAGGERCCLAMAVIAAVCGDKLAPYCDDEVPFPPPPATPPPLPGEMGDNPFRLGGGRLIGVAAATASVALLIRPVPTRAASLPGLQDLWCTAKRSSKNVRPQLGQATSARSLNACVAASLYAAMAFLSRGLSAAPMGWAAWGTGRRSRGGFSFSRSIHIRSHCGT